MCLTFVFPVSGHGPRTELCNHGHLGSAAGCLPFQCSSHPPVCREQHPSLEGDVSSQAAREIASARRSEKMHHPHAHSVGRGVCVLFWDGCTANESLWLVSRSRDGWYFPISNLYCASTVVLTPRQFHSNSPRASFFTLSVKNLGVLRSQAWKATK